MDKKLQLAFVLLALLTGLCFGGCIEKETPEMPTPTLTPAPSESPTPVSEITPTPAISPELPITPAPTPVKYGIFQLLISDAPADIGDFRSLVVTFSHARIFKVEANDSETGFEIRDLNYSQANLTELVGEKALPILNTSLEAGKYSKIELHIEEIKAVLISNETAAVIIPSEKLQIVKPFEITSNETTKFVFDINVVRKGQSYEYNLLPVIAKSGVVGEDVTDIEELEPEGKEKEKIEIEVKIEDNNATVRIELNKTESVFTINTTDRVEIVAEIINRTGLTSEQIEQYIEFEKKE